MGPRERGCPGCLLSRKCLVLVGFTCAVTLLLVGCSRQGEPPSAVAVDYEFSPQPPRVGPATVTVKLADRSTKPITGARIRVEADMTHAGMSPAFGDAKETEPGRYQAQLKLQMAGDWIILLHIILPDGKKLEREFDVRDVRPN
ncbi:MAG: FixH family protein [Candidatus Sulfotelmatobacter sp.]